MNIRFPLSDVTISHVEAVRKLNNPAFTGDNWQAGQNEYALHIDGFGSFYAHDGREVEYSALPGADPGWIQLYLNSHILVALMHQRGMINFHASSFIYNSMGIMILGETGAGKSSLTASFTLEGAELLSDDLTPVVFRNVVPYIYPLNRQIKLREDAAWQLNISSERLTPAEKGTGKFYLDRVNTTSREFPLNMVFMIEVGETDAPEFCTPDMTEKFSIMRSEICSWEILAGMPATEAEYLDQVLQIVHQVKIVRVLRPAEIGIKVLHAAIIDYLEINIQ